MYTLKEVENFVTFLNGFAEIDEETDNNLQALINEFGEGCHTLQHYATESEKEVDINEGDTRIDVIQVLHCSFGYFEWNEDFSEMEDCSIKNYDYKEITNFIDSLK